MKNIKMFIPVVAAIILTGCSKEEASSVSIIGGADGPTAIFIAGKHNQIGLPVIIIAAVIIIAIILYFWKRRKK